MKFNNSLLIKIPTVLSVVFIAGCSNVTASNEVNLPVIEVSADYPAYSTAEEAFTEAELVIIAKALDTESRLLYPEISGSTDEALNPQAGISLTPEELDEMAIPITATTVEVVQVISGKTEVGDLLEVSQLGGIHNGLFHKESNTTLLDSIDSPEILLFLNDNAPEKYDLINPTEGVYKVLENGTLQAVSPHTRIEPATLSKIEEIAEFQLKR